MKLPVGDRPLNICLISREYPPFFGGGIGTYTVQWSRALAGAGHRVVVVTVSGDGREGRERDGDVTVVRLPFIREGDWSGPHPAIATAVTRAAFESFSPVSVFAMMVAGALEGLAREFELDVVEAPETGALGWFALNARRNGRLFAGGADGKGGPAFVTVLHSPTEWIAKWNRVAIRGRRDVELVGMERDSVLWSDGVASPTGALARWAEDRWGLDAGAVAVLPHPLGDLEAVARRTAEGAGVERGRGIVFAGRLEPRKGVDTLIDGFGLVVGRGGGGAELTLDLVGEDMPDPEGAGQFGENRVAREPAAVRERIRRHGRCRPERVEELQAAAGIIAVPAPMDNFPYSCVEAMARGRVIVAARAGGMAEMIRDGVDGVLFEPGDAASCAAALERAAGMGAGEAAAMGRSAAGRILELCGNEGVVARRVGHYRAVMAGRGAGAAESRGFVFVNGRAEGLAEAAAAAGADFAHGWVRGGEGGRVRVYSTPEPLRLAMAGGAGGAGGGEIGPLVVSEEAAGDPEVAPLLEGAGEERRARSGWALAMVLLSRGSVGAVVPEVVSGVEGERDGAELAAAVRRAEAAEGELAKIKGSRGWGWLQRVYRVLHVVRGRG